ncbi:XRE family transcriptional regulator [Solirubrobacter phytolaccae]|uniref:XRE family transcriptional regulator n=1 Tax=Solirubrobacter phytolaccae TaxID=1404360 RepID=A0A9X3S7K9_9ACTN|nr:XRE family transcriptional regulator [Solirubrobacter phytolaccae]MDA0179286.1 XRE family transcriptional regulator [Solirubrobacter phytolaccae]
MDELAALVGERVRTARQERGLTVAALAQAAGIGKGSLSELEHGARNPTLSTLYALANALALPLAHLLSGRVGARLSEPGIEGRLLDVSTDADWTVEIYRMTFAPGAERHSGGHGPGVVEHLLVTAGRLRVGPVGEEREIGAGETSTWDSDVAHVYVAVGAGPVEAVVVIRSPSASTLGRNH